MLMSKHTMARFCTSMAAVLIVTGFASEALAQRPFEKFGKALDDLRPRGEILKKIFGEEESDTPDKNSEEDSRGNSDQQRAESLWRQQQLQMQQRYLQSQQAQNPGNGGRNSQASGQRSTPRNGIQQGRNGKSGTQANPNWQPQRPGSANAYYNPGIQPNGQGNRNSQNQAGNRSRSEGNGTQPSYYIPSPQDQRAQSQAVQQPAESSPMNPPARFAPVPEPPKPENADFMIRSVPAPVNAAPETVEIPQSRNTLNHGIVVEPEGPEDAPVGLRIRNIARGGLCADSGLKRGDVIVNIGGIPTSQEGEFQGIMNVIQQGDEMEFTVIRNGRQQKVMVQFGEPAAGSQPDLQFTPGETEGIIGDQDLEMSSDGSLRSHGMLKSVLDRTPLSLGMGHRNTTR